MHDAPDCAHAAVDRRSPRRAHRARPDVRDGRGRDPGRPDSHVEERAALAAGGARAEPGPRRPRRSSSTRTSTLTFAAPLRGGRDARPSPASTTSACARATASPSPCATSPSGRSPSGPPRPPARSSCRSTRGGRARARVRAERLGREVVAVRRRRARRAPRRALRGAARPARRHRRASARHDARGAGATVRGRARRRRPPTPRCPTSRIDPEDDATIFYTSGTTGQPKGALGTHRNICTNLMSLAFAQRAQRAAIRAAARRRRAGAGEQNAYLLSVPFFHATGCHSVLVANLAFGGKIVIMYKWDAGRALELIERERITTFGGVPAMVWQVLDHPDFATRDISSVQSIGYGGAPAAPELVRRIEAMFPGRTPSNGYGLTETSSVTTMNSGADYQRKPDSVGVPVAGLRREGRRRRRRRVLGRRGRRAVDQGPERREGLLEQARGDRGRRSPTAGSTRGDVARVDDEGFVYIVDRAKDMVIRGGENVYCVEVEAALFEHPAVIDAAVIGIPHQVLGEEVGAVVQLAPGTAVDRGRAAGARRRAARRVQGAGARSGSATSRCRATPPARSSSATCAPSSWVRVEPGGPRRRCPRRVPTPQRERARRRGARRRRRAALGRTERCGHRRQRRASHSA